MPKQPRLLFTQEQSRTQKILTVEAAQSLTLEASFEELPGLAILGKHQWYPAESHAMLPSNAAMPISREMSKQRLQGRAMQWSTKITEKCALIFFLNP